MEFKRFIFVIWQRRNIFIFVLFSVIFLAMFWFFVQPEKYDVVFYVDISREDYQETTDYRYDQFYRLQADEKFSETIVCWINEIELSQEIRENYQGNVFFMENLRAEKLSSSYIKVSFKTKNEKFVPMIMDSINKSLNLKIAKINKEANDPSWFSVVISTFVISKYQINLRMVIFGAVLMGTILGIFVSLFHYYWQFNENWN
jgi:capsular polysaccharide biosynthesis protein